MLSGWLVWVNRLTFVELRRLKLDCLKGCGLAACSHVNNSFVLHNSRDLEPISISGTLRVGI